MLLCGWAGPAGSCLLHGWRNTVKRARASALPDLGSAIHFRIACYNTQIFPDRYAGFFPSPFLSYRLDCPKGSGTTHHQNRSLSPIPLARSVFSRRKPSDRLKLEAVPGMGVAEIKGRTRAGSVRTMIADYVKKKSIHPSLISMHLLKNHHIYIPK